MPPGLFADEYFLGISAAKLQQILADKAVVDDDIGPRQNLAPANRDKSRIAGAGTNEINE